MTHPSQLVSQARDGYIAARVAELGNGFRRTGRSISTTWLVASYKFAVENWKSPVWYVNPHFERAK